jgi:PAS domain-containing protein
VGQWITDSDMTSDRWYPTVTTLYDGSEIIVGGVSGNLDLNNPTGNNPTYEYYPSKAGAWPKRLEILEWCFPFCLYPSVMQFPSGNVFMVVSNKTIYVDPATESISVGPDLISEDHMPFIYPFTPTFTMLPLTRKNNYKATLQVCGGSRRSDATTDKTASKECWQISPDEPSPQWVRVDDMPNQRVMPDSIILPDGKILYVNGAYTGVAGGVAGEVQFTAGIVYEADLFDPEAPRGQQWTTLAPAKIQRLYHSEALLVPSGHVITTGSEMMNYNDFHGNANADKCFPSVNVACTTPYNYQMERFAPPYVQKGEALGKPVINSAPATIPYNTEFQITLDTSTEEIVKVVIVRYSSVTHSTNTDQRLVELALLAKNDDKTLTVRSPWSSSLAPPGNWMLWVLNGDNIPSESKTVLLDLAGATTFNFELNDPNPPAPQWGSASSSFGGWLILTFSLSITLF